MSFLIRISDNMDSASNRLTPEQDNEDFMRYLCYLYTDNELREDSDNATAIPPARQRAIDVRFFLEFSYIFFYFLIIF